MSDESDPRPNAEFTETLAEDTIYSDEKRVAKVFGVKDKKTGDVYIQLSSKSKKPYGWRFNYGLKIYNSLHISKLFSVFQSITKAIGWKITDSENIEDTQRQLREKQETIVLLEKQNNETRIDHEKLIQKYMEQKEKLMRSKIDDFKQTVQDLKGKIQDIESKKIPESELQEFLYQHTWLFGTEYISAEPQKMRGAHSKFDFYLERYNNTRDIVEIKLISDQIITKEGSISAKVVQAVDQLIEYLESSIAAAHSTVISEEENIRELRPRGTLIIGKVDSEEAKEKLHKWNYRLSQIQLLTYTDVLDRAESVIKHIEKQEVVANG